MAECQECEDDSPSAYASDRDWQEYASSKLGIKLSPGYEQNARIYSFIFKKRFPKYANHTDIDQAMNANEWSFYSQLEEQAFCVCTNFIIHLHQVRNSRTKLHLIIGSCCFNRYFNDEAKKGRTNKRKEIKEIDPKDCESNILLVKGVSYKDLFDSQDVVLNASTQAHMKQEWNLLWSYLNNVIEKTKLGVCTFYKQKQTFQDKYTDKGFVAWASNVDATSNSMMQFKRYVQLNDMINGANNTKFMSEPFQNKSYYEIVTQHPNMLRKMKAYYYESDNWTKFIEYINRRITLEDMHISSMELIRQNDARNNYTESEKTKWKEHLASRQSKKQATTETHSKAKK